MGGDTDERLVDDCENQLDNSWRVAGDSIVVDAWSVRPIELNTRRRWGHRWSEWIVSEVSVIEEMGKSVPKVVADEKSRWAGSGWAETV